MPELPKLGRVTPSAGLVVALAGSPYREVRSILSRNISTYTGVCKVEDGRKATQSCPFLDGLPRARLGRAFESGLKRIQMKTWKKAVIGVVVAGVLIGIVLFSLHQANKGVVTVQTAKVANQDELVSLVTASGEIKPTTYTNVTAQGFGRITAILVKEGDHIKKGDKLLLQENVQASADVRRRSQLQSIQPKSACRRLTQSYDAAQADLVSQQANMQKGQARLGARTRTLQGWIDTEQDFDQRKSTYDSAAAAVDSARARCSRWPQLDRDQVARLIRNQAMLVRT